MGIANQYLDDADMLLIVWHGAISGSEWEAFVRQQLADDLRWPRGTRRLADITTLDPASMTSADVETVTALLRDRAENLSGTQLAIVAADGWDLARDYERGIDQFGATTIVFNHLEGACDWLGIDPASARHAISTMRAGLVTA